MKYQMTCPKCHHEWHYDNGYYDDNITRLGIEIQEIILQLQKHKQLPKSEQYARTEWWLSAKKALTAKQKQLAELKALRKIYDQQTNHYVFEYFKQAVKEYYGDKGYQMCLDRALKDAEAYTTADMMKKPYTRSNSMSDVTSIDKLT